MIGGRFWWELCWVGKRWREKTESRALGRNNRGLAPVLTILQNKNRGRERERVEERRRPVVDLEQLHPCNVLFFVGAAASLQRAFLCRSNYIPAACSSPPEQLRRAPPPSFISCLLYVVFRPSQREEDLSQLVSAPPSVMPIILSYLICIALFFSSLLCYFNLHCFVLWLIAHLF